MYKLNDIRNKESETLCILIKKSSPNQALRLSSTARKNATVGEIVNLMSVDTQKIQDSAQFLHYIWSSPLMVALAMYFLWQILGPSSMAGLAFMLVVLPANSMILAKKIREFQVCHQRVFILCSIQDIIDEQSSSVV